MKGNLVQHIILLVAEIDWKKGNMIHNSLSLEEASGGRQRRREGREESISVDPYSLFNTLQSASFHSIEIALGETTNC